MFKIKEERLIDYKDLEIPKQCLLNDLNEEQQQDTSYIYMYISWDMKSDQLIDLLKICD